MNKERVRSLCTHLKRALPVGCPVLLRIALSPRKDHRMGGCTWTGSRFSIQVSDQFDTQTALGVLVHEYAHALSWDMDDDEPHGEMFCEARTMCFASYCDWLRQEIV